MIDWKKLCEDSHANAKEKGFLNINRTFHGDTALFHSEISEALEDYRKHRGLNEIYYEDKAGNKYPSLDVAQKSSSDKTFKPCGIPIEFADIVIRVAQYCGTEGLDLAYAMKMVSPSKNIVKDFEELCARLHAGFSDVYAHWFEVKTINEFAFAKTLLMLQDFCQYHNIDLEAVVKQKAEYNSGRPHLHGGKKI
jgi:hypothetical protein